MWLKHDRLYHESLNNGTREEKLISVKKAATYYKVARNLPKEHDEDIGRARYEPILEEIDKFQPIAFPCHAWLAHRC